MIEHLDHVFATYAPADHNRPPVARKSLPQHKENKDQ